MFFVTLALNVAPVAGIAAAAWCAINHIGGWGWFLLVSVLTTGGSYKERWKQ